MLYKTLPHYSVRQPMSLVKRTMGNKRYWYLKLPGPKEIYLGPEDDLDQERLRQAIEYVNPRVEHYNAILHELESMLPKQPRLETPPAKEGIWQEGKRIKSTNLSSFIDLDTLKTKLDIVDISLDGDRVELRGTLPKDILRKIRQEKEDEGRKKRRAS